MLDNKYLKRITIVSNLLQYFRFAGDPVRKGDLQSPFWEFWHHHKIRFMLDQTGGRRQRRR